MNPRLDLELLGWLLVGLAGFQCLPALAALAFGEPVLPYAASAVASAVFGLSIALSTRQPDRRMRPRDGFLVVGVGWVLASLFGALPYELSDTLSPVDAVFESVAGFTTTGSTVLTRIESAPRSLLLWRSITQWLGGMGIIVFAIAILPLLGIGGMQLFRAEVPGPAADKLTPRVAATARRLWAIYVGYTALELVLLWVAGMTPFDALCHSLTNMSTGGFSTRNASIGSFGSRGIEWIVIVFMGIAGVNFVLHYQVFTGRVREAWRDAELRFFAAVVLVAVAIVAWLLGASGLGVEARLRAACFQVLSIATTTGYGTADYEQWPGLAHLVLLQLMIVGGMAGSTAGGMKMMRALLSLRWLRIAIDRGVHPHSVQRVKYGGRPVPEPVLTGILAFILAYGAIAAVTASVVALDGHDAITSASAALTALSNVGPAFGDLGPTHSFAGLSSPVKLVLCGCMVAGRLEIFTVLVLLRPEFWRR